MRRKLLLVAMLFAGAVQALAGDIAAQAANFMDAYAQDLVAGNRNAITNRYSRRGAIFLSGGKKEDVSFSQLADDYATAWKQPSSFQWQQLAYEPLGEQAILVTGGFLWAAKPNADPIAFTYAAILVVEAGELRIRFEDETPQSEPVAK